jgi:hypothetical protein
MGHPHDIDVPLPEKIAGARSRPPMPDGFVEANCEIGRLALVPRRLRTIRQALRCPPSGEEPGDAETGDISGQLECEVGKAAMPARDKVLKYLKDDCRTGQHCQQPGPPLRICDAEQAAGNGKRHEMLDLDSGQHGSLLDWGQRGKGDERQGTPGHDRNRPPEQAVLK